MRPRVSVLIPMYMAGGYAAEAIRSVYAQRQPLRDLAELELIVVDDGSPDDSAACAGEALRDAPEEIRTQFCQMPHRGQAASRNTALSLARGDWIFYLDADDVLTDGALAALLEEAVRSGADAVCAKCEDFISPELGAEEAAKLRIRPEPYERRLAGCLLIRRTVYDRVGGYDETLPSSETAQWMLRLTDAGYTIHPLDFVTLRRRYHRNNFGRRAKAVQMQSYMTMIKQRIKKHENEGQ